MWSIVQKIERRWSEEMTGQDFADNKVLSEGKTVNVKKSKMRLLSSEVCQAGLMARVEKTECVTSGI